MLLSHDYMTQGGITSHGTDQHQGEEQDPFQCGDAATMSPPMAMGTIIAMRDAQRISKANHGTGCDLMTGVSMISVETGPDCGVLPTKERSLFISSGCGSCIPACQGYSNNGR